MLLGKMISCNVFIKISVLLILKYLSSSQFSKPQMLK